MGGGNIHSGWSIGEIDEYLEKWGPGTLILYPNGDVEEVDPPAAAPPPTNRLPEDDF